MRKLRAIWNIIKANKWAVFTYEEAPNDPEWATFPFFRWNVSEKDLGFFRLIRERLFSIEEYNTSTVNNKKVYDRKLSHIRIDRSGRSDSKHGLWYSGLEGRRESD